MPAIRTLNGGIYAGLGRGRFGRLYSYFDPINDPFIGRDTLRGRYAEPRLAGKKFFGDNIVPRPTDDGNGPSVSPSVVYQLIYEYLTEGPTGPTWLHWIKPQIDAAAKTNCNCIRWYWGVDVLEGDASHMIPAKTYNVGLPSQFTIPAVTYRGPVTYAQLATGIQNVCTYLASKGMYWYPTATECQPVDYVTEAGLLNYIDHFITEIVKYPNVIACDVVMETDRCTYTQDPANIAKIMNQARASRGASTLPLTCSISTISSLNDSNWQTHLQRVLYAGVDFIDAHVYIRGSWSTLMSFLFDNGAGLPIAMGEGGLTYSGEFFANPQTAAQETTHPKSSELRAQHYQDVVAAFARRPDLQLFTVYGVCDQWPPSGQPNDDTQLWGHHTVAQDANYDFTTERPEWTGPMRTVGHEVELTANPWTLDLSGADTTAESGTTFAVGWGQLDATGTFNRQSNKLQRVHGATNVGLVNEYTHQSLNQTVVTEFNAADAIASGGVINWATGLRVQGGGNDYYLVALTSSPGTPATDGLISVYQMPAATLLNSVALSNPVINLAHVYRMTATATGAYPTTITVTVEDLTAGTTAGTLTFTDSSPALQTKSATSLPAQTGTVFYTKLSIDCNGQRGPTFDAVLTMSNITPTSVDLSWTVSGGVGPYRYVPQYIALDANQVVATTGGWTTVGSPGGQTGTSCTVSGLTPGQNYAFRVQVIDDTLMEQAA